MTAVVRLMGDLGVDSAGVRSSISRLKRRGVLLAMRMGGAAGYALSDDALEILREGDVRIFGRQRADESDGLVMVVFSIPESERDKRHQLRTTLTSMGFGTVSPGVWVAPGLLHDEVARTLEHQALASFVDLFRARYDGSRRAPGSSGRAGGTCRRSRRSTPSSSRSTPARRRAGSRPTAASRAAFETYVAMLTDWRRLPYLDPGLPLSLLPPGWNGARRRSSSPTSMRCCANPAREYALTTIHA